MSFANSLRRSAWYKRILGNATLPPEHSFRKITFYLDAPLWPWNKILKIDAFDCGPLFIPVFFAGMLSGIAFIVLCWKCQDAWALVSVIIMGLMVMFSVAIGSAGEETRRFFRTLLQHLGSEDLRYVMQLSSSQLTDLCLRRIQVLADEVNEIQKRTVPLQKERVTAENRMRNAYWFFRKYDFIPEKDWSEFFPKPE